MTLLRPLSRRLGNGEKAVFDIGTRSTIVTQGGRFGGYGLFLSKGEFGVGRSKPVFLYNLLDLKRTAWEGPELEAGKHTIVFDFKFRWSRLWQGRHGCSNRGRQGSGQEIHGEHHPHHVPRRRGLRHRAGRPHSSRTPGRFIHLLTRTSASLPAYVPTVWRYASDPVNPLAQTSRGGGRRTWGMI